MENKQVTLLNEEIMGMRSLMERMAIVDNGKGSISLLSEGPGMVIGVPAWLGQGYVNREDASDIFWGIIDILICIAAFFTGGSAEGLQGVIKPTIKLGWKEVLKKLASLFVSYEWKDRTIKGIILNIINTLQLCVVGGYAIKAVSDKNFGYMEVPYKYFNVNDINKKIAVDGDDIKGNAEQEILDASKVGVDLAMSPINAVAKRYQNIWNASRNLADYATQHIYLPETRGKVKIAIDKNKIDELEQLHRKLELGINNFFGVEGRTYINQNYSGLERAWEMGKDYIQKIPAISLTKYINTLISLFKSLKSVTDFICGDERCHSINALKIYYDESTGGFRSMIMDVYNNGGERYVDELFKALDNEYFVFFSKCAFTKENVLADEWAHAETAMNLDAFIRSITTDNEGNRKALLEIAGPLMVAHLTKLKVYRAEFSYQNLRYNKEQGFNNYELNNRWFETPNNIGNQNHNTDILSPRDNTRVTTIIPNNQL